jgi:uncharacterized protein (DUF427 family)
VVIAESNETVVVEGNHHFPTSTLNREYVVDSTTHTSCPWKGIASYFTLRVNGNDNKDAVWYYPTPKGGAEHVGDRVAFWKGVQVSA